MPCDTYMHRYMSVQTTFMKGYETDYIGTRMGGKEEVSARYYIQSPATKLKTDPGMHKRWRQISAISTCPSLLQTHVRCKPPTLSLSSLLFSDTHPLPFFYPPKL